MQKQRKSMLMKSLGARKGFPNKRFQEHLLLTEQTNLFQRKAISDAAQSQDQDSRKLIVQAASQNNKQLVTKRLLALALQNNEE